MSEFIYPENVVVESVDQPSLDEAIAWIAEGHALVQEANNETVLQALVQLGSRPRAEEAVRELARVVSRSRLDSGSVLDEGTELPSLHEIRSALDVLASKTTTGSLESVNSESVIAAQRENAAVIEVLCSIAAMSYSDLRGRSDVALPKTPRPQRMAAHLHHPQPAQTPPPPTHHHLKPNRVTRVKKPSRETPAPGVRATASSDRVFFVVYLGK